VLVLFLYYCEPGEGCIQCFDAVGWVARRVKTEWWGAVVAICLECSADWHMAQLMPLPLTVSCFSKIQIGFTFLAPAHPGSPGLRAVKRVCVNQLQVVIVLKIILSYAG